MLAYPGTEIYGIGKKRGWWDDNIFLKQCVGKEFHSGVPIFSTKNMNLEQMFVASADFDFWWNKKKGNIKIKNLFNIILKLLKNKDFSKIYFMGKSVIISNLKNL